jgi:hypothetical protein
MQFIQTYQIEDTSVCDALIAHYAASENKIEGCVYNTEGRVVDKETKDSFDVALYGYDEVSKMYTPHLQKALDEYIAKFYSLTTLAPIGVSENPNIQYYPPGGGFKAWHCERRSNTQPETSRVLVFMTYLNDVEEGGETEFVHQQLKIKPKKGLTVIFPGEWTHTHRGIPAPKEDKYIITGWLSFME